MSLNSASESNEFSAADVVSKFFSNLEASRVENGNKIVKYWRSTVESIYKNGSRMAAHSKVVDLKNGILLIEADHPGWIQMLHMNQNYILKGLRRQIPDVEIKTLAFRLQGDNSGLSEMSGEEIQDFEKKKLESRFAAEDAYLKDFEKKENSSQNEKNKNSLEMPENLKNLFDRFRDDMLTKNK